MPTGVWALLAVAIILRVAVVAGTWDTPTTLDPADFSGWAQSIASGQGFPPSNRAPGGGPSAFRPPGYPLFLSAVYWVAGEQAPPGGRLVEALILGPLSVALTGLIALRIWGRRVALVALGIAAVAPPMVILSTALVSEALFVPLVLGAVAAALEARRSARPLAWAIIVGVLLGLAELTRTNAAVLVPPLAWAVWRARPRPGWRGLVRPLAVVVAMAAVVAPWTIRNALVMHAFVPVSTEIGYTIAGTYDEASMANKVQPAIWVEAEHGASPEYAQILFMAEIQRWGEVKFDNRLTAQALKEIGQHPFYPFKAAMWNAIRMFHLGELGLAVTNLSNTGIPRLPALLEIYGFYPLGLLALAGVATRAVRRAPGWLWFVPLLLCTTVFITGFIRFRSGIDPFLAMLAALAVVTAVDRWRLYRARRTRGHDPSAEDEDQWASATTIRTITIRPATPAPIMTGLWASQNLGLARSRV